MNTIGLILLYLICGTVNAIITWKLFGDRDMKCMEEDLNLSTLGGWKWFYTIVLIFVWPLRVISNIMEICSKEES